MESKTQAHTTETMFQEKDPHKEQALLAKNVGGCFSKTPTLNVNAPEFFPRIHRSIVNSIPPYQSIMPPACHESKSLSNLSQINKGLGGGGEDGDADAEELLLIEFSNTLLTLTTSPGNYVEYLRPITDTLRQCQSHVVFAQIINLLYRQCVYEPNFRYTGAKVLNILCSELKSHPLFGAFKSRFLKRCQEDYKRRDDLIRNGGEDGLMTVCGLALFMGELFYSTTTNLDGQTQPLTFLAPALTDFLLTLVDFPSDDRIKAACHLLKMAGGHTEDALRDEAPKSNFNVVFEYLNSYKDSTLLSKQTQLLVQSVLDLRKNYWRRLEGPEEATYLYIPYIPCKTTRVPDFPQDYFKLEPVFYKDGKQVNREEAGFAEEDDEDEDYEGIELTEEEEQYFLKWLEESKNSNI